MTDIDTFFKKPTLPTSNSSKKRKLEPPNPLEAYKSARVESTKEKGKATIEDGYDDIDAGPPLPEGQGFDDDDSEGRFYGGGVSEPTLEILNFIDDQDGKSSAMQEKIDVAWLRKTALDFERRINKNAELRAKFEDQPGKFMDSEADLDASIKGLSILSDHPQLFEEFVKLGCAASLVGLLAHDNTDIASDAVEIISELTDDEVEAEPEQWNTLVNAMVDAQLLELLTSNLARLNESLEAERAGVYHTLSVFENLSSIQQHCESICSDTPLLSWLLSRLQTKESPVTQNKQYAAELLAILLQPSFLNRKKFTIELNGIEILLQLLSPYRKRDPLRGSEEIELMENLFDAITCCVHELEGKEMFVEAEGVELMLIMLREGKMSKLRGLRLLDHAVGGGANIGATIVCERLVEAVGLKTVFGLFMKKLDPGMIEHLLGIFAALLKSLPADAPSRIRTLAKFVEKDYEKIAKLICLRSTYSQTLAKTEHSIEAEKKNLDPQDWQEMELIWFSRRLDAGLFCLQIIDLILAWLCAEDDGARRKTEELFVKEGLNLGVIKKTLTEQMEGMDEPDDGDASEEAEDTRITKEMYKVLIGNL